MAGVELCLSFSSSFFSRKGFSAVEKAAEEDFFWEVA